MLLKLASIKTAGGYKPLIAIPTNSPGYIKHPKIGKFINDIADAGSELNYHYNNLTKVISKASPLSGTLKNTPARSLPVWARFVDRFAQVGERSKWVPNYSKPNIRMGRLALRQNWLSSKPYRELLYGGNDVNQRMSTSSALEPFNGLYSYVGDKVKSPYIKYPANAAITGANIGSYYIPYYGTARAVGQVAMAPVNATQHMQNYFNNKGQPGNKVNAIMAGMSALDAIPAVGMFRKSIPVSAMGRAYMGLMPGASVARTAANIGSTILPEQALLAYGDYAAARDKKLNSGQQQAFNYNGDLNIAGNIPAYLQ